MKASHSKFKHIRIEPLLASKELLSNFSKLQHKFGYRIYSFWRWRRCLYQI